MPDLEWIAVGAHCGVKLYISTSHHLASALFKHIDELCFRNKAVIQYLILFSSIFDPRPHLLRGIESQKCHLGEI